MKTNKVFKKCITFLLTFIVVFSVLFGQRRNNNVAEKHRIAVLIPFVGKGPESIPSYFPLFSTSASGSARLVDFFIIHNGAFEHYYYDLPSNVFLINLESTEAMVKHYLLRIVDDVGSDEFALESRDLLVEILTKYLDHHPYLLVEFKPALGHIFSEFLGGYSHWAYSDLDIVFGDIPRWMDDNDELINYDVVTYGFGDSDRAYLRGQWTVHRNDAIVINQLWRSCKYLSRLDDRFAKVLRGEEKLNFESAEACYSVQVLSKNHEKIRTKIAVKAFTDVHKYDSAYTHGVYLAMGHKGNYSIIYKQKKGENQDVTTLDPYWFENSNYQNQPMQVDSGPITQVKWRKDPSANCMYWVREIYRSKLCIEGVTSQHTIIMTRNQELTKQRYKNQNIPLGIDSAPFFHFQEWKRAYRHSQIAVIGGNSRYQDGGGTWILIEEGVIPLPKKLTDGHITSISPLGLESWNTWHISDRSSLPPHPYCLISGKQPSPLLGAECRWVVSWRMTTNVKIIFSAPGWNSVDETEDVTLILTLQLKSSQTTLESMIHVALTNIKAWGRRQPCVFVIFLRGDNDDETKEAAKLIGDLLHEGVHERCLVALITRTTKDIVSRRALLNMAMDAAPTRWIVIGVELERGLVLSKESSFFCRRRAQIHKNARGQVLILPQFAITKHAHYKNQISSLTLSDLLRFQAESSVVTQDLIDEVEIGNCEDASEKSAILESVNSLWWSLTRDELAGLDMTEDNEYLARLARITERIEVSFMDQMSSINDEDERGKLTFNEFPILMVDNIGPQGNILTHLLVREVEELIGKNCFNRLRLFQLATLGYSIYVLPGAFAASSHTSRLAGYKEDDDEGRRCERCVNQEVMVDIFKKIVEDEINRVSKTAVVFLEAL